MNELIYLYKKYWNDLIELKKQYQNLSEPLLINIDDSYLKQKTRLFVVGQQTNGWSVGEKEMGSSEDSRHIDELIQGYKDFRFNLGPKKWRSLFWPTVRKIETKLQINQGGIVWSNINRMDYKKTGGKRGRPPENIERILYEKLPLLPQEIRLAKPHLIIFFTGPYYDNIINALFNNPEMTSFPDKEIRKLAKVNLKGYNLKAYRTYHPNYLRLQKLEKDFIELIIEDFQK